MTLIAKHLNYVQSILYDRMCGGGKNEKEASRPLPWITVAEADCRRASGPISCGGSDASIPTPAEVFYGILNWLQVPGLPAEANVAVQTPEQVTDYCRYGLLMRPEMLAIWTYLRLCPATSRCLDRMLEVGAALDIGSDFDACVVQASREGLRDLVSDDLLSCDEGTFPAEVDDLLEQWLCREGFWSRSAVLEGLEPVVYQHPLDRKMLKSLGMILGMAKLIGWVAEVPKRSMEINITANSIEVTPFSMPELYATYELACRRLAVSKRPPLYVLSMSGINAFTSGAKDSPMVALSSMAVNCLTRDEMLYVLGHELGHAANNHQVYSILGQIIGQGLVDLPLLGNLLQLAGNVTLGPMLALWSRRSELTADRAGLLACQNVEAALRALMKLGDYPISQYRKLRTRALMQQAISFEHRVDHSSLDKAMNFLHLLGASHPQIVARAANLLGWIASGEYDDILKGTPAMRAAMARRMQRDPDMQLLLASCVHQLETFACREFGVGPAQATRQVRNMLHNRITPEPPLNRLIKAQVECSRNGTAGKMNAVLVVNLARPDGVYEQRLPLDYPTSWDDTPKEIGDEMIRAGSSRHVVPLYEYQVP
jgi:Zn-dependent protease with chaperone function